MAAHPLASISPIPLGDPHGLGGARSEKRILERIRNMGTNLIVVNADQTQIIAGRQRQITTVRTLVLADAETMAKECLSVAIVAPSVSKKLTVRWEDQARQTPSSASSNFSFFRIRPQVFRFPFV